MHGDRDGGLDVLGDRRWDAVIDTSGYVPRVVAESARRLARGRRIYAFVSTIGAYGSHPNEGIDETHADRLAAARRRGRRRTSRRCTTSSRRSVSARCRTRSATRALIVRPGLIVGPHDPTERFTYWVRRLAGSGRVLVPDARGQPVQVIDGRDLAAWLIDLAGTRADGTRSTRPGRPPASPSASCSS